jgi:DNA-binding GntR family transcriptional regulator
VAADPPLVAEGGGEPLGEEAWAVLDARVAAETGGCILACERARREDLDRLGELVDRMTAAPDFAEYRRADTRFHIGLAEAARSPRLVATMTELQGQMSDLLTRIPHPPHVLNRSNAQHRRLLALIARRDAPRAVRLMRDHIEGTEHILAGLLPPVGPLAPMAWELEPQVVGSSSSAV